MVDQMCLFCKGGKNLCGRERCELIERMRQSLPRVEHGKSELFGSSPPAVFVGRYGYPRVNVGPMLPPMRLYKAERLDDTRGWFSKGIEEVISLRSSLYRSNTQARVTDAANPRGILEASQILAMSSKSIDTEVKLNRPPGVGRGEINPFTPPMGPAVEARRVVLTENARVPRKVDSIVGDTDARANTGILELYDGGVGLEHIMKLLSIGLLGRTRRRRLVPTRWSITATEDAIAKGLMEGVKGYQELGQVELYRAEYIGNHFHVILVPRVWSFEMVETWLKGAFWGESAQPFSDWEGYRGRKTYADKVTGAYYSARLMVLEHLVARRRQATAILYREITNDYWAPLGVWVIRETVRKALEGRPEVCDTLDDAVKRVTQNVHVKHWAGTSKLLKEIRTQRTLLDYMKKEG